MIRVCLVLSPDGPLLLGDALTAVASRAFGDWLLLRIDDLDAGGDAEDAIGDLEWLGVEWDEGPVRQSQHGDFGITHVLGSDEEPLCRAPVEYVRHGRILGADDVTVASLRDAGIPAEAVRAYLDELGLPEHDVQLDLPRIRRLVLETIAALPDEELAARAGAPPELVPALRGARDLVEAREFARAVLDPEPAVLPPEAVLTLGRFAELRAAMPERLGSNDARSIVRELNAVGGDLKALRLALTGRGRGPELAAVVAALSRDEALRRVATAVSE